jgi:dolichol-phosphate mannosyltransferase
VTSFSVVVPSFNEAGNVAELVRQLEEALAGRDAEVLYVDDSTDATPEVVREVAARSHLPVAVVHRPVATGGLSGAVVEGIRRTSGDVVVVMDGDLQHPPSVIPMLLDLLDAGAGIAVASRYTHDGEASGLASLRRRAVSTAATRLSHLVLRRALDGCSDPMTGFFAVRRAELDLSRLDPSGFKILLEVLGTHDLRVAEVPFTFRRRHAGTSKATLRQGALFLRQLLSLRLRGGRRAGGRRVPRAGAAGTSAS